MTKRATFETNRGTIVAELYEKDAPLTVANFEKLANEGFYDGVKFHRVIADFVVQGGDPQSRDLPAGDPRIGSGGPGYRIKCETQGNPRTHEVGALSMAHAPPEQIVVVGARDDERARARRCLGGRDSAGEQGREQEGTERHGGPRR